LHKPCQRNPNGVDVANLVLQYEAVLIAKIDQQIVTVRAHSESVESFFNVYPSLALDRQKILYFNNYPIVELETDRASYFAKLNQIGWRRTSINRFKFFYIHNISSCRPSDALFISYATLLTVRSWPVPADCTRRLGGVPIPAVAAPEADIAT
jgi:hypothetical protein